MFDPLTSLALALAIACPVDEHSPAELRVGHWVRAKGVTEADSRMAADEVEVRDPADENEIIGTVRSARPATSDYAVLDVDGQPVFVGAKCDLVGVDVGSLVDLAGKRVEVEGYWRSPWKLSARKLEVRDKGRDRVEGRIDAIERTDDGLTLSILGRLVSVNATTMIVSDDPLAGYALAPRVDYADINEVDREIDDDDDLGGYAIGPNLWLGTRLEWRRVEERDLDLDKGDDNDRSDDDFSIRTELRWAPTDWLFGLVEYRHAWRSRLDAEDGLSSVDGGGFNEAHLYFRDVLVDGLDLQVGRQDFDEPREWLYDENLDAIRVILSRASLRAELFAAGVLSDGDPIDEETDTLGLVVSTETTSDWSVGAYALHRSTSLDGGRDATHLGLRGLGEFVSRTESWAELSYLTGTDADVDLAGLGIDVGTTWSPSALDPWYFTFGYAYGSGDGNLADGEDATYRQTGLHDNNAKFGGVTSFRYYGELFEPELANLRIATVGVGRRFNERDSIDLVVHKYDQDIALPTLVDSQLDMDPSGISRDLGWEVDLVYGSRSDENINLELVFGRFDPGSAFPGASAALVAKVQVRVSL